MTSQQRLPALDGLRGIAAVSVVVYHVLRLDDGFRSGSFDFAPRGAMSWLLTATPLRAFCDGRLAVWLFFVLSGFVLTRRYWHGESTRWGRFYVRRLIRLYLPVFGSMVCAIVLLGIRQELDDRGHGLVDLADAGTSVHQIVQNIALVTVDRSPLNGVWWSMRWEVWFSLLVLPMLGVLGWVGCGARRRYWWTPAVFGGVCLVTVSAVPWLIHAQGVGRPWSRALLYLPMFGIGVTVAAYEEALMAHRDLFRGWRGWVWFIVSLVAFSALGPLGILAVRGSLTPMVANGLTNALAILGAGGLVAIFVVWPAGIAALSRRPVAWIGARSYSLYLVHLPLLHLLVVAFEMQSAPLWFVVFVVAASLAYCAPFYRWIELPSIRLAARVGSRGRSGGQALAQNGVPHLDVPVASKSDDDPDLVGSA